MSRVLLFGFVLAALAPVSADDPAKTEKAVPAIQAALFAGENKTVEFVVNGGTLLTNRNMCFLNSMKDYKADGNFTVVIFDDTMKKFKKAKITNPYRHFLGKKIQVTGGVRLRAGKPQIIIKDPSQIAIVKQK